MRVKQFVAALAAAVIAGGCAAGAPATPEPTGFVHYDRGGISFDYPAAWRLIGEDQYANLMQWDIAIVGTGSWRSGCRGTVDPKSGDALCDEDHLFVDSGQIVVRVYRAHQFGPEPGCQAWPTANATLGSNAVNETGSPNDQTWQIRAPNTPYFGAQNNVWVEARTDDPAQMAKAEALIASLKIALNDSGLDCYSADPSAGS